MTAVCASMAFDGRPQSPRVLDGVLAVLALHGTAGSTIVHREFDHLTVTGAAVWSDPTDAGHADEAASHGASVQVLGDVAVFNRSELAATLAVSGDASDLEVVEAAYRRWGRDFPNYVHGDFALVIIDTRRQAVMVVRDHAGHVPLVVHTSPGRVAVASNALALTGLDGVGHELDGERVAEVLALAYDTARTFVVGVRWVEPGTAMWVDAGGCDKWRWWGHDDELITDLGSLDAHAEALRVAFDAAVAGSLRTPGLLGAAVSGGLDSTSVLATAARVDGDRTITSWTSRPPAHWVGPDNPSRDHDEFVLVAELAGRYPNIEARSVFVDGTRLFDHHHNLWELGSGPGRNPCNSQWIHGINEEAAASGVTLLLTGARGNIAFSADGPRWLLELAKHGRLVEMGREVDAWARSHNVARHEVVRTELLALVQPQWLRRLRGSPTISERSADWHGATALRADQWDGLDLAEVLPGLAQADTTGWTRTVGTRFASSGTQADAQLAARALWGVTRRDPTVDRRVMAVAMVQPEWWRRHRGVDRAVVRRAMADRLPASIVDRTRRGAQLPDWFERLTEAREQIAGQVQAMRDHPESRRYIDVDRVQQLMQAWPAVGSDQSRGLQATKDYRLALTRAVHVSRYVQWFEQRARRVAGGGPAVVVDRDRGFTA